MFVRIVYATVQSFKSSPASPLYNVWVYLALLLIPDAVSVSIYTVCGFLIKNEPATTQLNRGYDDVEIPTTMEQNPQKAAVTSPSQQDSSRRRKRRQRRIRGPIHMLIDALRGDD